MISINLAPKVKDQILTQYEEAGLHLKGGLLVQGVTGVAERTGWCAPVL